VSYPKAGVTPRWPVKADKENPKQGTKPETGEIDKGMYLSLIFVVRQPEDRVSTVRWNPKGMRRSTGP
jgi:hypothetical protein